MCECEACKLHERCLHRIWTALKDCHCAAVAAATELPAEVDRPQEERKARLRGASTDGFPSVTSSDGGADSMSSAYCLYVPARFNRALQEALSLLEVSYSVHALY